MGRASRTKVEATRREKIAAQRAAERRMRRASRHAGRKGGKREERSGERSERLVIAEPGGDEPLVFFPASLFPLPASRYFSAHGYTRRRTRTG